MSVSKKQTEQALKQFINEVVSKARTNLAKRGKNATGNLSKSISGDYKVSENSFELSFSMEDYGTFQDLGVSGKKVKYKTDYSYKDKMPPPSALDKWIVRKGIAPRDKSGKFTGRKISSVGFKKSIQFLIARSIFFNGIKPTLFFTDAFNSGFKGLDETITEAYGLDVETFLKYTLNAK